jgi:GNAT superfamily N-acetyltransferase
VDIEAPVLRIGEFADSQTVSALATHVYLDTYASGGVGADVAREVFTICSTQAFEERLTAGDRRFVLAERRTHLLGFVEFGLQSSCPPGDSRRGIEIIRLYVHPAMQGQRIGARLLRRAESDSLAAGCDLVWLTAWAGNHRALRFYENQRYQDVGATQWVFEDRSYECRVFIKPLVSSGAVSQETPSK